MYKFGKMETESELRKIEEEIASCNKCPLKKTATRPVPGEGNCHAEIMFIGEAPGYWEDQRGIPFCGAAGKLLDELLLSINLKREDVFVANILKHRPPENRDPLPNEVEACKEYLDRQLKAIRPKVIVALGRFAMAKFFPYGKISRDHGIARLVDYGGQRYIFVPMFHPAAALRSSEVEKQLRRDFLNLTQGVERFKNSDQQEKSESDQKEKIINEQLELI